MRRENDSDMVNDLIWVQTKCGSYYIDPRDAFNAEEAVLLVLATMAMLAIVLIMQPIVKKKYMRKPVYLYILNWEMMEMLYLIFAKGFRRVIQMLIDQCQTYHAGYDAFEKSLLSGTILLPIVFVFDQCSSLNSATLKYYISTVWFVTIMLGLFSTQLVSMEIFREFLDIYIITLFVVLMVVVFSSEINALIYQSRNRCQLMAALICVYLMSWFWNWVYLIMINIVDEDLYSPTLGYFVRAVGYTAPIMKVYVLARMDKRFRLYIFKTVMCYAIPVEDFSAVFVNIEINGQTGGNAAGDEGKKTKSGKIEGAQNKRNLQLQDANETSAMIKEIV